MSEPEEPKPKPRRWKIETLLANGINPMENLEEEELAALASGIQRNKALAVPIVLTKDEILIDGHQRLRILLAQGQTYISENQGVWIDEGANRTNALEHAVRINFHRRHQSPESKARLCLRLMKDFGWSQGRVAEILNVHRPQVSRWLKGIGASTDAEDEELRIPTETAGLDGAVRNTVEINAGRPPAKPKPHPWSPKGKDHDDVKRLTRRLQAVELADGLTDEEGVVLATHLGDLVVAAEGMIAFLTGADLDPEPDNDDSDVFRNAGLKVVPPPDA